MKKVTGILLAIACLFAGIAIGFIISPVKGGLGNNAGNTTNNYYDKKEDSENPA
jgi:F0F1-type ATP synthase membrane subunit c/vacuolar-type H+-ATPase subunit K